jgi:hypothetical protein
MSKRLKQILAIGGGVAAAVLVGFGIARARRHRNRGAEQPGRADSPTDG